MLRVGLTGGIATGKSYARARFAALGMPTVDADVLARQVVEPGTVGLAAIVRRFGSDVLDPAGALNRPALAAIVFEDREARQALEAIVHPQVRAAIDAFFEERAREGHQLAMADIPLLYETNRAAAFHVVVVVACSPEQQLARLQARDGLSVVDAGRRLAAQWPIAEKVRRADIVIDTGGTHEETDRQVHAVFEALRERATRPA